MVIARTPSRDQRTPAGARAHIASLSVFGQVLAVSPAVVVEALRRAADPGKVKVVLAKLEHSESTYEDAIRASELLVEAGRLSGTPHRTIHAISIIDALLAAMAGRLGGIILSQDTQDLDQRRSAGARIVVRAVPI